MNLSALAFLSRRPADRAAICGGFRPLFAVRAADTRA